MSDSHPSPPPSSSSSSKGRPPLVLKDVATVDHNQLFMYNLGATQELLHRQVGSSSTMVVVVGVVIVGGGGGIGGREYCVHTKLTALIFF